MRLPVYDIEAELLAAHAGPGAWVLSALTGSGKTTQVPRILRRGGDEARTVILQPRHLAARLVAGRIADEWAPTWRDRRLPDPSRASVERGELVDISLGWCRRLSSTTRPDLRLGVMSAT